MEYRNLGKAGVKVSAIGIGCNQFGGKVDKDGVKAILHRALDEGINFFDTANVYGNPHGASEEFIGAALEGERERVVIATKVRFKMGEGPNDVGASRYHILSAVEASLRRLRTDHITCIKFTHGMNRSPSKRRCARLTISSARARSAISARVNFQRGSWRTATHSPR